MDGVAAPSLLEEKDLASSVAATTLCDTDLVTGGGRSEIGER